MYVAEQISMGYCQVSIYIAEAEQISMGFCQVSMHIAEQISMGIARSACT